jgi:hypothetical protein
MYICLECGARFEIPERWEERHGFDYGPAEYWSGCPCCYGSYTEAYKCDVCGEWITDSYVKLINSDKRICDNCYITYELGEEDR